MENQTKIVDGVLKNFANYNFKHYMVCLGRKNNILFFGNGPIIVSMKIISEIVIQSQFTCKGDMKIIKKWNVRFENVVFTNKSNNCIALTNFKIQIWKIDNFYNLDLVETILTCKDQFFSYRSSPFNSFFSLHEYDNLIVISVQTTIYMLIKEENENWKLKQTIKIGGDYDTLIKDHRLNDQGNILILSFLKYNLLNGTQQKLLVVLKIDGVWRIIKEINLNFESIQSFCFLDNDKFILLDNDCKQENLSACQVFPETLQVELIHKQKLEIYEHSTLFRFMKQRNFLIAQQHSSILLIKWNNKKFYIYKKLMISKGLELADIINEDLVILHPAKVRSTPYNTEQRHKIQIQKLY